MPEGDTLFRTAAGLAAVPRRADGDRGADAAARRGARRSHASSAARSTAVEAQGKNLLIRLRQRPRDPDAPADERLVAPLPARRALAPAAGARPARARGARAPSRSASTRRSSSCSSSAPRRSIRRSRSSGRTCWRPDFDAAEAHAPAARSRAGATSDRARRSLDQRALAGIGNVYKSEVLWIERVSPFAPVAALDDDDPAPAGRRRRAALLTANARHARPERVTTAGDRGAPGPLYVYGRDGPAVPPLPDADPRGHPGPRPAAHDVLVPGLPAEPRLTARIIAAHVRALRRPRRRAVPARRAVAVHRAPRALRDRGLRLGRGVARGGRRLESYRDIRAFRDDPGREAVGRTRPRPSSSTCGARRSCRPSTCPTPSRSTTRPAGTRSATTATCATPALCRRAYRERAGSTAGPTPRSARAGSRTPGAPASRRGSSWRAPRPVRWPGQPGDPRRRRHVPPLRRQRREPGLRVPPRADRRRLDRASTRSTGRCSGSSPRAPPRAVWSAGAPRPRSTVTGTRRPRHKMRRGRRQLAGHVSRCESP